MKKLMLIIILFSLSGCFHHRVDNSHMIPHNQKEVLEQLIFMSLDGTVYLMKSLMRH